MNLEEAKKLIHAKQNLDRLEKLLNFIEDSTENLNKNDMLYKLLISNIKDEKKKIIEYSNDNILLIENLANSIEYADWLKGVITDFLNATTYSPLEFSEEEVGRYEILMNRINETIENRKSILEKY